MHLPHFEEGSKATTLSKVRNGLWIFNELWIWSRLRRWSAPYQENRQRMEDNTKRTQLVTFRAPGRKGATGDQCAVGRLQEKSGSVLADGAFDE